MKKCAAANPEARPATLLYQGLRVQVIHFVIMPAWKIEETF
ncbi:MAG: hypothetical protein ACJ74Y_15690 [Bryobacteraceae bacterium]